MPSKNVPAAKKTVTITYKRRRRPQVGATVTEELQREDMLTKAAGFNAAQPDYNDGDPLENCLKAEIESDHRANGG